MAANLGDFLQFSVEQFHLQQRIFNVYYYRVVSVTGLTGNYLEVLSEWVRDNINSQVRAIQVSGLAYIQIEAKNLTNAVDIDILNLNDVGSLVVDPTEYLPTWVSASFRLIRESLATRSGWKRYAGGHEAQLAGNFWGLPAVNTNAIEDILASDIVLGLVQVAEPVILRRPLPTPVPTSHIYSSVGDAIFRTAVGSQGSRKVGIGI